VPDGADLDATVGEFTTGRFDVGDGQVRARADPGAASVSPTPNWTEQAEPGGVSCTTRKPEAGW